jgi:serine/threonine protein phosphatase 1
MERLLSIKRGLQPPRAIFMTSRRHCSGVAGPRQFHSLTSSPRHAIRAAIESSRVTRSLTKAQPIPRTIAIGDVHGCNTALATLLEGLELQASDTIVMLGDVIDRGPDSRDAINQLLALRERCRLVCLQGNHEQMMLDALDGRMPIQEWLVHGGAETLDSYGKGAGMNALDPEHIDFVRTWGDVYETDSHFFAHGNYLATRPLDRQPWQ